MAPISKPASIEVYGNLFGSFNREINYVIEKGSGLVDPNTQHIATMPTFTDLSKGAISRIIKDVQVMDSEIERKLQGLRDTIKKVQSIADVKKMNEIVEAHLGSVDPEAVVDELRAQGKAFKAFQIYKVQPVLSAAVQAMPSEPQPNCCNRNALSIAVAATALASTALSVGVTYYCMKP